jgi:type II secretory pathway pseudopilin PulG
MAEVKRSPFEILVVVVVVALTIVLGASLYAGRTKIEKSNMLINEMSALRSSLLLYKIVNHKNAPDLAMLTSTEYAMGGVSRPYIERLPLDKQGKIVDPFGNPYLYDARSGWVSSTTHGCERW